ncbi:MAG: PIN domain-containing protein [Fimbriimonadales bacterium]|nr:PIN domain-containing protein [Fimbriimonadales bacterium]
MNGFLLDTDVVIEVIRGDTALATHLIQVQQAGEPVYLHALSYYETKRGLLRAAATRQIHAFERLCQALPLITLTPESLDIAAQIYADLSDTGQVLGDADILIASSAIAEGLTVVSRNLRHYTRIPNLRVVSWRQTSAT